jgi:hypothetical protein
MFVLDSHFPLNIFARFGLALFTISTVGVASLMLKTQPG